MGVGIHRSKIALYIYDKTFEDNDEDKIVDADFIERNMGFYEILDEWKTLINHDVVSELVEPLYDELESFAVCTDTTIMIFYGLLVHKGFCSYRIRIGFFAVSKTLRATKVFGNSITVHWTFISLQTDTYADAAQLQIAPTPDTP